MSIILNEPVTNVVKNTLPLVGHDPVRLRRREDGRVEVAIQNDGVGSSSLREDSLSYGLIHLW
jgi:nitrate/nitrite-specific signal transduction histidine kinase